MANEDQGEKTEEPTAKRREDFRNRGQVAQTKELGTALVLLGTLMVVWLLGEFLFTQLSEIFTLTFSDHIVTATRQSNVMNPFIYAMRKVIFIVAPVAGIMWVISFASSAVQVGFLVNEEAMKFNLERLSPISGFKRVFSMKSLVEGVKSMAKVSVVVLIAYFILKTELETIPYLVTYNVSQLMGYISVVFIKLTASVTVFMFLLAAGDYLFQKYDLEQEMMMTKQELKEEMKSQEGDPLIKARIKRTQREMAQQRMMEDVPKADVIITNPTHIAVALRYTKEMAAPTIVAMGGDLIAQKIKEVARENSIPIVENKPLARTMFKTLKIGQAIPRELFKAVAEVLSYVFRLKSKRRV